MNFHAILRACAAFSAKPKFLRRSIIRISGAIYDLQEADGSRFLVLELPEGDTLAERVQRGPIPIEETPRQNQNSAFPVSQL
jgi:hypothetical protein